MKMGQRILFGLVIATAFIMISPSFIVCAHEISGEKQSYNHIQYEVPSYVKRGDIVLMDCRDDSDIRRKWFIPGPHNDHAALYLGNNTFVHASAKGVQIVNYTSFHLNFKNFAFVNVTTANSSQKQAAVDFALNRLGASYQIFYLFPFFGRKIADYNFKHHTANLWYCMELPWAAYYNQGIDIDRNGWFPCPRFACVIGNDILYDNDVQLYTSSVSGISVMKFQHECDKVRCK